VHHIRYFHGIVQDSVDQDKGERGQRQFSRAFNPPDPTFVRKLTWGSRAFVDRRGHMLGSLRATASDEFDDEGKIVGSRG
jgi:hypothetical protein